MSTFRLLDLYCGAGGSAKGYLQAGFHVTGVDIIDQPNYCGNMFFRGDAIEVLEQYGHLFDVVHASPPCQAESAPTKGTNASRNTANGRKHPRLIDPTREALDDLGLPYVIENVPGAPLRKDLMLCGEMFGLGVLQHRYFELRGFDVEQPHHPKHRGRVRGWRHGEYFDGPYVAAYGKGGGKATVAEMQRAKDIHWTDVHLELTEAIPPAYSRYVGEALMTSLNYAQGTAGL